MSQMPRFVALDSLRGLAALGVVAAHMQGGGWLFDNAFVDNGWLLVDFFFVLSGFVIAANYGKRIASGFSFGRFMLLRLGRLYPLHAFVLALYVALELGQWLFSPAGWSLREPFAGAHSLEQLALTAFLLNGFSLESARGWSAQSWSISVELWLYAGMALLWRLLGGRAWIAALVLTMAAAAVLAAGYSGGQEPFTFKALRGIIGFPIGVALWELWRRCRFAFGFALGSLLECAAVMACIVAITRSGEMAWQITLVDVTFAATVLIFAADRGAISRLLHQRFFVLIGTLSYSIYLIHPMVIGRGVDLLRQFGLGELASDGFAPVRRISAPPGWDGAIGIALVFASVMAAWFTWKFIETPAREWSRRKVRAIGADR